MCNVDIRSKLGAPTVNKGAQESKTRKFELCKYFYYINRLV